MKNNKIIELSASKPLLVSILLASVAMVFRLLDIFVFRLDDLLGEIILSKTIGFIIVIVFVGLVGWRMRDIGFKFENTQSILTLGIVVTVLTMIAGYGVEYLIFAADSPQFLVAGIDPKAGVTGGLGFALFLLLGNVVNCFMEEGLFRGIMIPLLNKKYSVRMTIFLQGLLFGIWHIPWAFKWYMSGIVSGTNGFLMALVMNSLPMLFMGIVFGVMFYYTDSIWTPWIAHFIINSVLNFVHLSVNGELDPGISIRMGVFQTLIFLLIPLMIKLSQRLNKNQIETRNRGRVAF